MKSILELRKIIETSLRKISYPKTPLNLYEPIEYALSLGGKRIRPILVLLAHQLYNDDVEEAINPALAIEMFHNFTLLHDDIMDNASLRRGKEPVHVKWDVNSAILSGDTMLVYAYQLITQTPTASLTKVLNIFNETAIQVCEGQKCDMNFESQTEVSINSYIHMIKYKTAVLLGASLKIGACIGGAEDKEAQYLYNFGIYIGIAFQLQDDLLDTFGDQDKLGKQIGGDILENKKTYLYLKSQELLDSDKKLKLKQWFSSDHKNTNEKINAVKKIYESVNIQEQTKIEIQNYYKLAILNLNKARGDKTRFRELASMIITREN